MELKDSFVGQLHGTNYYRTFRTESYVEVPPALIITDERGDVWSLGFEYAQHGPVFNWNVLRNDKNTGELAEKIVYRGGKLRIHGWYGVKTWNGRTFI